MKTKGLTRTGGVRDLANGAAVVIVQNLLFAGPAVVEQHVVNHYGQAYVGDKRLHRHLEGVSWARGHSGPDADALRAAFALA